MLVPEALEAWPGPVAEHDIEIRAVAPDLRDRVHARRQPISAHRPRAERILVPAPRRTLRIANGIAEFVRDHLSRTGPLTVELLDYAEADPADRELVAVLCRRVPRELLTMDTLRRTGARRGGPEPTPAGHDLRADELVAQGLIGPRLGAVPRHRECGTDPRRAAEAYHFATQWCLEQGCHHAVAELGLRGLTLADPDAAPETWWGLVHDTAIALGALGREDEAEQVLMEARVQTTSPLWHSTIAYTLAMHTTRHHDPARRDLDAALGWVNTGIALCGLLPDRAERAVKLGFDLNGRALIEARRGHPDRALRLVQEAIDMADRDLPGDVQPVHKMVLRANRAQLYEMLGQTADALREWDAVIAADPAYPDYYIDRGNLLYKLGRVGAAVADYETAMETGLPFPEPYFNRSQARFAAGDLTGALADLDHALELDPAFADAYPNRAGILAALDRYEEARAACDAGLALTPDDPYLRCVLGQVETAAGHHDRARDAFDRAIALDASMATAWACRGELAFTTGDLSGAVQDLSRALELTDEAAAETPALLFNRAMALRATGRENEALADLERAGKLAPGDEEIQRELTR
ncbi:tetratricopeptide repeat protein [Actinomadura rudentiformis]|uniref:Tetratricopeptide repeat protein n=2 Tax=Actinomadura rudentiformis TaxID=359158 RepID=A0A6H9Z7I8_9ACTN|nr:tetratricopeptide repeat protein [Actinomadura rudentiformis]